MQRNVFLFVVWSKAVKFEREIIDRLAADFNVLHSCRIVWPRREFVDRLWDFYKFGPYFTWWNKARKCGRGPFLAVLIEDLEPAWSEEFDTRGQKLLADSRVYQEKQRLRKLTGHSNIVHSSVTRKETEEQVKSLFGLSLDEILSPEPKLEVIGQGKRRIVYRLGDTGDCLKCYLPPELVTVGSTVEREIRQFRFDRGHNTCAQEYDCWRKMKSRLPESLMSVFPEKLRLVCHPERGWSLVEPELRNFDGSKPEPLSEAYRRGGAMADKLLKAFKALMLELCRYNVRFFDPPNILVQTLSPNGDFRLRIVDFEPTSRTLIPIDRIIPALVRGKIVRRANRYLKLQLNLATTLDRI